MIASLDNSFFSLNEAKISYNGIKLPSDENWFNMKYSRISFFYLKGCIGLLFVLYVRYLMGYICISIGFPV